MGLAFAIPIDVAMNVEDQIVHHGKVSHGRLGVTIQELSQPLAVNLRPQDAGGALVSSGPEGQPRGQGGGRAR